MRSCDSEIERLQSIIKKLQRAQFGRRSERLDADQLALALEDLDGDIARIPENRPFIATDALEAGSRRKPWPRHLPREDLLLDVDSEIRGCSGGALHALGESVSEMLDWVPAQLRVVRITRPKYACRIRNNVVQAAASERLIAGGLATPALLAQVLVSKYCDHTLLYRQSQIFARHGVDLDARRSPDGLVVARADGWKRCKSDCAKTCSRPTNCSPTTRRSRCSIRAVNEQRRGDSGSMPAAAIIGTLIERKAGT